MMGTLYNGKEATKGNVLELLQSSSLNEWNDMTEEEENIIRMVALQDYDGAEDDLEYLVDRLQEKTDSNWQTCFDILTYGDWYYMKK